MKLFSSLVVVALALPCALCAVSPTMTFRTFFKGNFTGSLVTTDKTDSSPSITTRAWHSSPVPTPGSSHASQGSLTDGDGEPNGFEIEFDEGSENRGTFVFQDGSRFEFDFVLAGGRLVSSGAFGKRAVYSFVVSSSREFTLTVAGEKGTMVTVADRVEEDEGIVAKYGGTVLMLVVFLVFKVFLAQFKNKKMNAQRQRVSQQSAAYTTQTTAAAAAASAKKEM
jgi:hypothetical protein